MPLKPTANKRVACGQVIEDGDEVQIDPFVLVFRYRKMGEGANSAAEEEDDPELMAAAMREALEEMAGEQDGTSAEMLQLIRENLEEALTGEYAEELAALLQEERAARQELEANFRLADQSALDAKVADRLEVEAMKLRALSSQVRRAGGGAALRVRDALRAHARQRGGGRDERRRRHSRRHHRHSRRRD